MLVSIHSVLVVYQYKYIGYLMIAVAVGVAAVIAVAIWALITIANYHHIVGVVINTVTTTMVTNDYYIKLLSLFAILSEINALVMKH